MIKYSFTFYYIQPRGCKMQKQSHLWEKMQVTSVSAANAHRQSDVNTETHTQNSNPKRLCERTLLVAFADFSWFCATNLTVPLFCLQLIWKVDIVSDYFLWISVEKHLSVFVSAFLCLVGICWKSLLIQFLSMKWISLKSPPPPSFFINTALPLLLGLRSGWAVCQRSHHTLHKHTFRAEFPTHSALLSTSLFWRCSAFNVSRSLWYFQWSGDSSLPNVEGGTKNI